MFFLGDPNLEEGIYPSLGSKALNLHKLTRAGFKVPPGFVIEELFDLSALESGIKKIGGYPVAVRSSGSLEDLPGASFAGLYETFLYVNNFEDLKKSIQKCFESKNSERLKDYLNAKKISWVPQDLTLCVLIQKMVKPRVAGVLFTLNPTNGREEEMYIELCEGVGERLVSGHVTPTRVTYDWVSGIKVSEVINNESTNIPCESLEELILNSEKIQAFYGHPQDIEWAIGEDDQCYILQSRPITTFTPRSDRPELTNADLKDGGISARVCTPMMYSAYREALRFTMGDYFKKINLIPNDEKITWIYSHYGRVYWNAGAVKEGLKKLPDFKEEDFDRDLGIQKNYGDEGPHITRPSMSSLVSAAIPVLIGLHKEFLDCQNMIDLFRSRFEIVDEELKTKLSTLKKLSSADFDAWFLAVIRLQNETEKNYFRTIYNNSNYQSEYKSFLKKLPGYNPGDEIDLMGELHGVAHLDVQTGLSKLVKVADFYGYDSKSYYSAREQFLKAHYHHGPAELDIQVPRWGEKKEWVDDLVRSYVEVSASQRHFKETYDRIFSGLSFLKKRKFLKFTESSRIYLRLREEMRSYSTRCYYLLRLGLLEFARRNSISLDDIFMYEINEVQDFLLHEKVLPDIHKRKLLFNGYRNFKAPNEFGGTIEAATSSNKGLHGLGCSPGEITGRARVIFDIHKTLTLTKDDILITPFTDPGWTPVLARVGGVVTEVGGLLSHAAVIGREYGIPAILNLIDATKLIPDGSLIKINGKTGVVEILED